MSKYTYKTGRSIQGLEAQTVGDELERIEAVRGLTPANVVDESRPKRAVLHSQFEWHDPTAAEEFRKQQARMIVNAVAIQVEGTSHSTQAFVSVRPAEDFCQEERQPARYLPASSGVADTDLRGQHLTTLKSRLRSIRRELSGFQELAQVAEAIDAVV